MYEELGYYTHKHTFGRVAFYMKKSYRWLSEKEKARTSVNYCQHEIHGLYAYQPREEEKAKEWYTLQNTVQNIYDSCKSEGCDV